MSRLQETLTPFKNRRGALVAILQKVQEKEGYLSPEAIAEVAGFLKMSESDVYGVASFYALFHFSPRGKHEVKVCLGTACHVRGGQTILESVERDLKVKSGEMTADGLFSLERVACFGSCALAPVVVIDKDVYGRMTTSKARETVDSYRTK